MKNKFTDQTYLDVDLFGADRDVDIKMQTSKIVKVRKKQICNFEEVHDILPGQFTRYDKALVDGKWGSCYSCLGCLDKWLIEIEGQEPNNE